MWPPLNASNVTQYPNDPIKCIRHYDNVFHGRESMFIFCVFPVFSSGALVFPLAFRAGWQGISKWPLCDSAGIQSELNWKKKHGSERRRENNSRRKIRNVNKPPPHQWKKKKYSYSLRFQWLVRTFVHSFVFFLLFGFLSWIMHLFMVFILTKSASPFYLSKYLNELCLTSHSNWGDSLPSALVCWLDMTLMFGYQMRCYWQGK